MPRKLAIKRLTASDLTFFVWQFRNRPAGNQKAINLNADVFVGRLYPALPETEGAKLGRISLDLSIYGPGAEPELNVQRKIVKTSSYKNWRLNGEFVDDPDNPARFSSLESGDFVIFEFFGELSPEAAKAMFIAHALPEDQSLHLELDRLLGISRMVTVQPEELTDLIRRAQPEDTHPINELTLDEALEDVALGGSEGAQRLVLRRSGRKVTKEQLARARDKVEEVGQQGEGYVNDYLIQRQRAGLVQHFEWVSEVNAISPYDFRVVEDNIEILVDAKATLGQFERSLHISLFELREMAQAKQRYDLYRVFEMSDEEAKLRICSDTRAFASTVLQALDALPSGVSADAVSVNPDSLPFGEPISIVIHEDDMEPPLI